MDEIIKKLISEKVITEETSNALKKVFTESIDESKKEIEEKVRDDLMEKYNRDVEKLSLVMEKFAEQELKQKVIELDASINQYNKLQLECAEKLSKSEDSMRKELKKKLQKLEEMTLKTMKSKIKEIHENEVVSRRAYLNAINENNIKTQKDRENFKTKAAAIIENIVNIQIPKQMEELKEDIIKARQSDFGREIFESFYVAFKNHHWNTNQEFRAIKEHADNLEQKNKLVKDKANKIISEYKKEISDMNKKFGKLNESVQRKDKIEKLLSGLKGDSKLKMKHLLESASTNNLDRVYDNFLPQIITENKKPIQNKENKVLNLEFNSGLISENTNAEDDDEIIEITRRAAIKK